MKCEYCGAEIEIHPVGYGSDHVCPKVRTVATNNTSEVQPARLQASEIRRLSEKAANAPWKPDPSPYCEYIFGADGQLIVDMRENYGAGMTNRQSANRDLIVTLRNHAAEIADALDGYAALEVAFKEGETIIDNGVKIIGEKDDEIAALRAEVAEYRRHLQRCEQPALEFDRMAEVETALRAEVAEAESDLTIEVEVRNQYVFEQNAKYAALEARNRELEEEICRLKTPSVL